MQDTSSLEYSLTATVCLESQQVLKLRQLVSTDDFSIPACATVFGAADSAVSRGKAFDANIAADGLRGLVDAPRKFLAECIDVTPTVAHAEEYARLLHTRAAEKRLRDGVLAALDEGNPATAIAELCKAFLLDNAGGRLKSVSQALTETLQSLSVQEQARIDTGFPKLDSILKGFEGGQLIIVGARPGVGKSAFLLDLAESAARAGNETLFVSLEMNASELTERLLVRRSMATMDELIDRDLTDELWDDIDGLFEEPVCDSIFGSMNLYAMADGLHVWTNFLLALMDETDSAFAREQKATNPRIQKYTAKYRR